MRITSPRRNPSRRANSMSSRTFPRTKLFWRVPATVMPRPRRAGWCEGRQRAVAAVGRAGTIGPSGWLNLARASKDGQKCTNRSSRTASDPEWCAGVNVVAPDRPVIAKDEVIEPAIEVRDLVKRYGELAAVDGIDFSVAQGEIFCAALQGRSKRPGTRVPSRP